MAAIILELSWVLCIDIAAIFSFDLFRNYRVTLTFNLRICFGLLIHQWKVCQCLWKILSNELVGGDLVPWKSFSVVVDKTATDELDAGDSALYFFWEDIVTLRMHHLQLLMSSCLKWNKSDNHLKNHSSDRPNICLVIIACSLKYLGCHVQRSATLRSREVLHRIHLLGKSKISNLNFKICGQQVALS